jgi:hypothetical protein
VTLGDNVVKRCSLDEDRKHIVILGVSAQYFTERITIF